MTEDAVSFFEGGSKIEIRTNILKKSTTILSLQTMFRSIIVSCKFYMANLSYSFNCNSMSTYDNKLPLEL